LPIEKYYFLLLYAPDSTDKFSSQIRGKTWFQKEMFVLSKHAKELDEETDYVPHLMGSYSEVVEELADQFEISGYTETTGDSLKLTLEGREFAEKVWNKASSDERKLVTNVKALLNDLSYYELLALIYTDYPDTAVNSQERAEVDRRRSEIAINLLKKDKVTFEKASQIAKKSRKAFSSLLKEKGVDLAEIETKNVLHDRQLIQELEASSEDSKRRRLTPWETIRSSL